MSPAFAALCVLALLTPWSWSVTRADELIDVAASLGNLGSLQAFAGPRSQGLEPDSASSLVEAERALLYELLSARYQQQQQQQQQQPAALTLQSHSRAGGQGGPGSARSAGQAFPYLQARNGYQPSESEAYEDKDKRGSYMSLCHFKICNMGRKRNLQNPWVRQ